VRTDLQDTLRELFGQRRSGQIPDFDRLVIETTGLADPAPVVQTLASDTMLAAHYRLDGVVTLVDAVNGIGQLDTHPESVKQAALADRIFITKTDLSTPPAIDALRERLEALNPRARISTLLHGEIEPAELTGLGLASARAGEQTLSFLGESLAGEGAGGDKRLQRPGRNHDPSIRTLSLRFDKPFSWTAFTAAIELLTTLRGPDLLRVKGIVNVDGQPVVVQGVQHVFHDPVHLDRWPSEDRDTRLVFITRNLEAQTIRNLMEAVVATSSPPA
jgi:G3E family GTPase